MYAKKKKKRRVREMKYAAIKHDEHNMIGLVDQACLARFFSRNKYLEWNGEMMLG